MPATPDFKERLNQIKLRNMNAKHKPNHSWPIEKKIEVVASYLVLANLKMVAATTGVKYETIKDWKSQPWWAELEREVRATQNIEMDTKLSKIVERSLDATLDRVENGEFFYDQKKGALMRRPAALRDVARVSVDMLSKRELLRGNATERKETTQTTVGEQLKLLAAEFAKWQGPKDTIDVEMVEVVDAEIKVVQAGSDAGEILSDDGQEPSVGVDAEAQTGDAGNDELSGATVEQREGEGSSVDQPETKA